MEGPCCRTASVSSSSFWEGLRLHVSLLAQWGALGLKVLGILSALTMVVSNTVLRFYDSGGSSPGVSWQWGDEASGPCLIYFWGGIGPRAGPVQLDICPMTSGVLSLRPTDPCTEQR